MYDFEPLTRRLSRPFLGPPQVYDMEYFSDPRFPEVLDEVWNNQMAFIERQTGHAAILGEWGGSLEDKDRVVQHMLAEWMARNCLDDNYWQVPPQASGVGIGGGVRGRVRVGVMGRPPGVTRLTFLTHVPHAVPCLPCAGGLSTPAPKTSQGCVPLTILN